MKKKIFIPLLLIALMASIAMNMYFAARQHKTASAALYVCPMDPQITSDRPGKCSLCGMDLVPASKATKVESTPPATTETASVESDGATKYQCPMHPTIVQDHPGDCPICGMKLVKMRSSVSAQSSNAGGDVGNRAEVTIDLARQQLIGLRTAKVEQVEIGADWKTVGRVQTDPTRLSKINVKAFGYVEHIFVDFVGKPVKRGEPLFTYYSPELFAAQQEYLLALKQHGNANPVDSVMLMASRQKLRWYDVPATQIAAIEKSGEPIKALTFTSPVSGVVSAKNVVEGSSQNPGDTPYEIADLSTVWIVADAYQGDAARVKMGAIADVTFESLPNQTLRGKVSFIDPILDPQSRTFKLRVIVDNEKGLLKPDMFAELTFLSSTHSALTIPADAIIPSGRGSMVFVALGEGKFSPRTVSLGEKNADRVEVIAGLSAGDEVVTRANFLVDSESSLRAALATVGGTQ